ncbi:ester cyclase [Teichococcus oryzae]|uniref:Ester cyclase n=1 Tax=Teichococcus oryzae TaxID=1608942 RepID=A0A5B2TE89_9PROT|nr:ester cyclase [Pseudoroseomonas oryzae]KAA2212355.1 ester cyclase [Pseudoroseomonas oryzae]
MAGCRTLPDPCETPEADPPSREESENVKVVGQFIDTVWNTEWSDEDTATMLAERSRGNAAFVPRAIEDGLSTLRNPGSVRHRRDRAGKPIKSSGPDDYRTCVNAVHMVAQDLRIEVLDMITCDNIVVVQMFLRGTDRRADGRKDLPGAFGTLPPTGQRFRMQTSVLFQLHGGRIIRDKLVYGAPLIYETS